jgi:curved DNA-binding protein CbpA
MSQILRFDEIVEAINRLSDDEQKTLFDILRHRLRDAKRRRLIERVKESSREYKRGEFKQVTVEALMREVES